jgi:hypothetical protein
MRADGLSWQEWRSADTLSANLHLRRYGVPAIWMNAIRGQNLAAQRFWRKGAYRILGLGIGWLCELTPRETEERLLPPDGGTGTLNPPSPHAGTGRTSDLEGVERPETTSRRGRRHAHLRWRKSDRARGQPFGRTEADRIERRPAPLRRYDPREVGVVPRARVTSGS